MNTNFGQGGRGLIACLLAVTLPSISTADTARTTGFFVEAEIFEVDSSTELSGFTIDDSESGLGLAIGYGVTPNLDVVLSYRDMGDHFATDCPPPRLCLIENGDSVELDAFALTARGTLPVSEMFDVYAMAGVMRWEADFRQFDRDDTDVDMQFGAGVGVRLHRNWRLDAQYSRVNLDLESYGMGLQYRFR